METITQLHTQGFRETQWASGSEALNSVLGIETAPSTRVHLLSSKSLFHTGNPLTLLIKDGLCVCMYVVPGNKIKQNKLNLDASYELWSLINEVKNAAKAVGFSSGFSYRMVVNR